MITKNKYHRNKILYIPLEIFDREIDGGLLLAFEALKEIGRLSLAPKKE